MPRNKSCYLGCKGATKFHQFPNSNTDNERCLKILIENRKSLTISDIIVLKTIPEAVISFKQFSTRKENVSEEIIKLIANLHQENGKLNDFIDILTAGFAGNESLVTNTILTVRIVVQQQGKHLTVNTLEFVLEQISVYLVQKSRSHAEASVAFLIIFIKVMPSPLVANHLEVIMKSLSAMAKDTKRYCRMQIGYFVNILQQRSSKYAGTEYSSKKAKGDMKKKGKVDPYAYIPLSRNALNKRSRAKHSRAFKSAVKSTREAEFKGVKTKIQKPF